MIKHTNNKQQQTNTKMSTNKNAYEIRLEILSMAEGHAMAEYHENLNTIRIEDEHIYDEYIREFDLSVDQNRECEKSLPTSRLTPDKVKELLPSTKSIAERARALYAFVEGR